MIDWGTTVMKKPISVQFKFFEDLSILTDPTEPRMSVVQTMQIPAQHQKKLSKRVQAQEPPTIVSLLVLAAALAICGSLLLLIVLHR